MSITDELREWKGNINTRLLLETVLALRSELNCIADRIDAEHERGMADAELSAAPTEAQLSELGYVKLPVDANGVPIRVGDVLTDGEHTFVVGELATFGNGSWSIRNEDGNAWKACDVTHHHKPTVEDVLREFADRVCNSGHQWGLDAGDTIAEYAAKLRLVEEGE